MSFGSRLREARKAAKLTQAALGKITGDSPQAVSQWESGATKPEQDKLTLIASAVGVSVAYFFEDTQEKPRPQFVPGRSLIGPRDLPVYAASQGGAGHMIVTFDPVDYVKRPVDLESVRDAYAILIVGNSMEKAYRDGDMALVNPLLQPKADEVHVFYDHDPVQGTAESMIKNLLSWNDRKWRLEQFNPEKKFDVDRVDWPICHRVTGKYNRR